MADDKTTIVETGGGGMNAVALIVGLVAIVAILYVVFGTNLLSGETKKIEADIKVETPK